MNFSDYIKHKVALGRTNGTIQGIMDDLRIFWDYFKTQNKKLKTISQKCIEGYLFYLRQKGYSSFTIKKKISTLRDYFRYKGITNFPELKISSPQRLPKFLENDDIKKIRDIIINERDKLIFDTLYATGMRISELCNLNCTDINGTSILITGKGNKERKVLMPDELYQRLKKFASRNNHEALFTCRWNGKRLTRTSVNQLLIKYAKEAGLNKRISPHMLRHTFATRLLNNGMRMEALSSLLGHTQISTTQIYAQLSHQKIKEEYLKYWED